jgi:hypothetical protein
MDSTARSSRTLSLTTGGITLLGVLVSVGATVGLGLSGPWWVRAAAGLATTVLLGAAVKLGTRSGRGPLARLALWMIGHPTDQPSRSSAEDGGSGR